jgi:hypothetical protein
MEKLYFTLFRFWYFEASGTGYADMSDTTYNILYIGSQAVYLGTFYFLFICNNPKV